jgi:hypothetical protein
LQLFALFRFRFSSLNDGTDTSIMRIGLGNQTAAEFTAGVYFRSTTNNAIDCITANTTYTVTTASNFLADTWYVGAWHLDGTGTNVFFYLGGSETNLTCVATNSSNIPHNATTTPVVYWHKYIGSTKRMTNNIDYFKVWAKR